MRERGGGEGGREGRRERERERGSEADSGRREREGGSIVFIYLKSQC